MMEQTVYQIDAFTDRLFGGNPAAVCPLETWLPDDVMQNIAAENNLSETAFFVADGDEGAGRFGLRWFTPKAEVDLCGHATLASAHLILDRLQPALATVSFDTKSGRLDVERRDDLLVMDFPSRPAEAAKVPEGFSEAVGATPVEFLRATKNMAVFASEETVDGLRPDFKFIATMEGDGLIVTAPGQLDPVSGQFTKDFALPGRDLPRMEHISSEPFGPIRHGRAMSRPGSRVFIDTDVGSEIAGNEIACPAGRAALYLEGKIRLP